jgi:hypothetical protein
MQISLCAVTPVPVFTLCRSEQTGEDCKDQKFRSPWVRLLCPCILDQVCLFMGVKAPDLSSSPKPSLSPKLRQNHQLKPRLDPDRRAAVMGTLLCSAEMTEGRLNGTQRNIEPAIGKVLTQAGLLCIVS